MEKHIPRSQKPYTLEACVVRLVDKIAYVGRDIEDAIRVKILHINDIPLEIRKVLGPTNGSIIDTLVRDIIENSYGRDAVQMSPEKGEALESLIKENYRLIYMSDRIKRYEKNAQNIIEGLFTNLMRNSADPEMLKDNEIKVYNQFYKYIRDIGYGPDEPREQMVADFIAGMTDNYAVKCFDEIFWV